MPFLGLADPHGVRFSRPAPSPGLFPHAQLLIWAPDTALRRANERILGVLAGRLARKAAKTVLWSQNPQQNLAFATIGAYAVDEHEAKKRRKRIASSVERRTT